MKIVHFFLITLIPFWAGCYTQTSRAGKLAGITYEDEIEVELKNKTTMWRMVLKPYGLSASDKASISRAEVKVYAKNKKNNTLRVSTFKWLLSRSENKTEQIHYDLAAGESALIFNGSFAELLQYSQTLGFDLLDSAKDPSEMGFQLKFSASEDVPLDGKLLLHFITTDAL